MSRKIPDAVWPLLNSGWAPLAALCLLKLGADSNEWRDAMKLLNRVLDSVDIRRPAARSQGNVDELAQDLADNFHEIGMIPDRIHALLRSWRTGIEEVEAAATARPVTPMPVAPPVPAPDTLAAPVATAALPASRLPETPLDPQAKAVADTAALLDEIPFDLEGPVGSDEDLATVDGAAESTLADTADEGESSLMPEVPPELLTPTREPQSSASAKELIDVGGDLPDPVTLLDLLMVLSSWFRVYDHDRGQNRWLKVIAHHPAEGTVTFAEFNGQNKLQLRTQLFLDDLVAGRAEPIDLGPAARRSLDAYLGARRDAVAQAEIAA